MPSSGMGTTYVWLAGVAVYCVSGAAGWWRWSAYFRGGPVRDLDPLHLALLTGGADRAVAASLAALRAACAVRVVEGSLRQAASPHPAASPLDLAVYAATGRGHAPQSLSTDPAVRRLIDAATRHLMDTGLLLGARERRRSRLASAPAFGMVLLCAATIWLGRIYPAAADDAPAAAAPIAVAGLLATAGFATAAGLLSLRAARLPSRTRALLSQARADAAFLDPAAAPDWSAHSPEIVGLATAIFGPDTIRSLDPALHALCTRWPGRPVPAPRRPRSHSLTFRYSTGQSDAGYQGDIDTGWGDGGRAGDGGGGGGDGGGGGGDSGGSGGGG